MTGSGTGDVRDDRASADVPDDAALTRLAARLLAACRERRVTVATAESCTGGLVAHAITEVAGSSESFRGGIVAYSNGVKQAQLGVPAEVIAAHGAVSAQTARAMAEGARARLGADLAVAITGVAGPGGGSDEKPVGLTYVAAADGSGVVVRRFAWPHDRSGNKRASAAAALTLLLERVAGAATGA